MPSIPTRLATTLLSLLLLVTATATAAPAAADDVSGQLKKLSLEELLDTRVTLASKKSEQLRDAPAAIYVIGSEEIRRSGLNSIPELLRLVPGLEVARISASKWAITSRGFNGTYANKLLVLIDGRSVYTPTFSGVNWDEIDLLLPDVDRIEVIRGPGATLWGANAVNGVINIVTLDTTDTDGWLLTGGAGDPEQGFAGLRYGTALGSDAHLRLWAKGQQQNRFSLVNGSEAKDDWRSWRGGIRSDWQPRDGDRFTLQGTIFDGEAGQTETVLNSFTFPTHLTRDSDISFEGGSILGRWTRQLDAGGELSLQLYYDRSDRNEQTLEETRQTGDLDLQHRFPLSEKQELVWGAGYRLLRDDFGNSLPFGLLPDSRTRHLYSAFLQDDITLQADRWRLIVGSKFEHNDFTGFELQPNLRLVFTPDDDTTVWGAVSRAVRTPSRVDNDTRINFAAWQDWSSFPPTLFVMGRQGSDAVESEELTAYELGLRMQPAERLSLDLALFLNDYSDLVTTETGTPFFETSPAPAHMFIPLVNVNNGKGQTYGGELLLAWDALDIWRLTASYSYLQMHLEEPAAGGLTEDLEGSSPQHQAKLRSQLDLPQDLEFDASLHYVDRLKAQDIDSYLRLDLRLGWMPADWIELSLVGQNLLDDRHAEFSDNVGFYHSSETPRGGYAQVTLSY